MSVLALDNYMTHDWESDEVFQKIMNTVKGRMFQPPKTVKLPIRGRTDLEKLSLNRMEPFRDTIGSGRSPRSYEHKICLYDNVNELERYGAGRYNRQYEVIVSFEDALDFIYSCLFKTKQGSLIEFCESRGMNYKLYSRQHLGGGCVKDLYITDLKGFSEPFDLVLAKITSADLIDQQYYYDRITQFCVNMRNAIVRECGKMIFPNGNNNILASVGLTSVVFYSDIPVSGDITLQYKLYKTNLKILCVPHGTYFQHINESLCS